MSDWRVIPPGFDQAIEYHDGYTTGQGSVSTIHGEPENPVPKREFPPGFHGAAPGPSHPEVKARWRVKAGSRRHG